jgi:hypothetical protein
MFLLGYELVTSHLTLDSPHIRAFKKKNKSNSTVTVNDDFITLLHRIFS